MVTWNDFHVSLPEEAATTKHCFTVVRLQTGSNDVLAGQLGVAADGGVAEPAQLVVML